MAKVIEKHGDILTSTAYVIAHQVNCMGVMGSGLAKQIRDTYPIVYKRYHDKCSAFSGKRKSLLGEIQPVPLNYRGTHALSLADTKQVIVNCFGQYNFGTDSNTVYTSYSALRACLVKLSRITNEKGKPVVIAIPYKIGCGRGNGDWYNVVLPMIAEVFKDSRNTVEIWQNN